MGNDKPYFEFPQLGEHIDKGQCREVVELIQIDKKWFSIRFRNSCTMETSRRERVEQFN